MELTIKKGIVLLIAELLLVGLFSQCTTIGPSFQSIISSPQESDMPAEPIGNSSQDHIENTNILNPDL